MNTERKSTHLSLERGLEILQLVAAEGKPISLADMARRLTRHRSSVHHMMQSLVRIGYLHQNPKTHAYTVVAAKIISLVPTEYR